MGEVEKKYARKEKNWKKKVNFHPKYLGGTPLHKLYRYVLPKGYAFWAFLVWKQVYTLPILVWKQVWFSKELRECMNMHIYRLNSKWIRKN